MEELVVITLSSPTSLFERRSQPSELLGWLQLLEGGTRNSTLKYNSQSRCQGID